MRRAGEMSIRVERSEFDENGRCQYHVLLKPHATRDDVQVQMRVPVEVAVSVSETGELADLTFIVPKKFRNDDALSYVKSQKVANYVDPRVFIAFPGMNGDSVMSTAGNLEFDAAGRIVGVDIQ